MEYKIVYETYSANDYYELILNDSNNYESVYYLLKQRLAGALFSVYKNYGFGLDDDFEDTVNDFFLYLYDGDVSGLQRPFAILKGVRNKSAFFGWVVGTYRNFLLNKAREEEKRRQLTEQVRARFQDQEQARMEDHLWTVLCAAIAYADQQLSPRNRFVCYRFLLSLLDHTRAIPQEHMAGALNMLPVTYRVCTKRQKERLQEFVLRQETGQLLNLDPTHQTFRDILMNGFNHLYDLLLVHYDKTLELLPTAAQIRALRQNYGRSNGTTMHEELRYGLQGKNNLMLLYNTLAFSSS